MELKFIVIIESTNDWLDRTTLGLAESENTMARRENGEERIKT